MRIAGLSIEGALLRASIVSRQFGSVKHLKAEEIQLPENGEERTGVLRENLERWKQEYGIKGVVFGLDFKYFSHHYVALPVTAKADIGHALPFEMEKHLPLPPEEYLYDFHTVSIGDSGSRNFVLSVKKNKLAWLEPVMEGTGLKLMGVRCSGVEALNEFIRTKIASDVLFIYPGDSSFFILGLKDYAPVEIKSIRADADAAGEMEKLSHTFTRGIYAAGIKDSSRFTGLDIRELSYSIPDLLALSAFTKRAVDLNFVPEELRPRKTDYHTYAIAALTALSVLVFFLTSVLAYYKDYSALRSVQKRIAEIGATSNELVEIKKKMEEIDSKRQFLYTFKLRRNRHINILKQMSVILPRDAWLTSFSSDEKGKVEIEGYARRSADLIGPLENSPFFKNVEFSSPVTVRQGKERFSIRMEIEK